MNGHPLFAAGYDLLMWPTERFKLGPVRRELLAAASGRVLEIGAGSGASLPYYKWKAVSSLAALEPDPFMAAKLRRRAEGLERVSVVESALEVCGLEDQSLDCVVSTLVLCTVPEPEAAARSLRRLLKPDGKLLFIEHHRREPGFWNRVQRGLNPFWNLLAAGCVLDRPTLETLDGAGFEVEVRGRGNLAPFIPFAWGAASRR